MWSLSSRTTGRPTSCCSAATTPGRRTIAGRWTPRCTFIPTVARVRGRMSALIDRSPVYLPGLEVVAAGTAWQGGRVPQQWTATLYPGPKGNFVFNAATIWWGLGMKKAARHPARLEPLLTSPRPGRPRPAHHGKPATPGLGVKCACSDIPAQALGSDSAKLGHIYPSQDLPKFRSIVAIHYYTRICTDDLPLACKLREQVDVIRQPHKPTYCHATPAFQSCPPPRP